MCPRKKPSSTNPDLINLIRQLKKKSGENKAPLWQKAAEKISGPKRRRVSVNISKIARHTQENDAILVPGKVLGSGSIEHSVQVAALDFSNQAREKIVKAKGKCFTIEQLMETNPKGTKVKVMG